MNIKRTIAQKLANTKVGITAVQEKADLSAFKQRPSFRVIMGIILMGISYIIGLPAISVLGVIAYKYDMPVLFLVGSPILFVVSHLVFLLGLYFAGANYTKILLKWAVRRMIETSALDGSMKR
jgi:hypothetical protein